MSTFSKKKFLKFAVCGLLAVASELGCIFGLGGLCFLLATLLIKCHL